MLGLPVPRIYLQSGCHLHNGVGETSAYRIPVLVRYVEWVDIDRAYTVKSRRGSYDLQPISKRCCLAYRSHACVYIQM